MFVRRRAGVLVAAFAVVPLVLVGCTGAPIRTAARPAPPTLAVTPAADSRNVPISAEIGTTVTGGKVTEVVLTDDKGGRVSGAMRPDGTSWIPDAPLRHKQAYRAAVTASNSAGKSVKQSTSFTTMDKPAKQMVTNLSIEKDRTYGVAMPVTVAFDAAVPEADRAGVQRRLFVTTDPPQPGAWSWSGNGRQVSYRAPDFWKPGTKISVRAALAGVPMGAGSFGDTDRTATAAIGKRQFLEIDNATKQMSVFKDDQLVRKIPVSLGKSSTPTSSGKMVIMEKHDVTVFDTTGSADPYVVTVYDAQRLTWGGEFIHAAPWSVGDQGYTNVSHGCTNVSDENAQWLMKTTQIGDLVTVKGTEVELTEGNGWTAWNAPWEEFVKGSALPVPADLKPAPNTPVIPSTPATAGSGAPSEQTPSATEPSTNPGR